MTIEISCRSYELPLSLTLCPACRRADLVWDGHGAWRCTYMRALKNGTLKPGCRHGLTLRAIFEDGDLELRFATSQVRLTSLTLTPYGKELYLAGLLRLPWLTDRAIRRQLATPDADAADTEHRQIDRLMRKAPAPTRSIKARRIRSNGPGKGEEL